MPIKKARGLSRKRPTAAKKKRLVKPKRKGHGVASVVFSGSGREIEVHTTPRKK